MIRLRTRKIKFTLALIGLLLLWYALALPKTIFNTPYSTVLYANNGELLGALIADDGQWRFPQTNTNTEKFRTALLFYEDEYFFYHPGFNPLSILRAAWQNIKAGKVISGGSTITMQVIRMSRNKPRTLYEKGIEIILATRLEWRHSKEELFRLYASHAPFGGNVVGVEAAAWRYFARSPDDISWAEAALLAVLPNNPSMVHPGKNRDTLKKKRDKLLNKLWLKGAIDSLTYQLACSEPLPKGPKSLPQYTPHLIQRAVKEKMKGKKGFTTIDFQLQEKVTAILEHARQRFKDNEIYNAAVLVLSVKDGKVLAYVGNVASGKDHGMDVDIITSARSTGSILKPFLYAAMINNGQILPQQLLSDVPLFINGFHPQNFSQGYAGAVPADIALARSLNVPAVGLLRSYHYEKFYNLLKKLGMHTLHYPADHYGLSLILGGAEGTLWDITSMYRNMAYSLHDLSAKKPGPVSYHSGEQRILWDQAENYPLDKGPLWHTANALSIVHRPDESGDWNDVSGKYAWKTGTSFGHRDAWAVGFTPEFCVGVWVGNADGEGRPGLTGLKAAAPVMFEVFDQLPNDKGFTKPTSQLRKLAVCAMSGFRASENCEEVMGREVYWKGLETVHCPFHKKVHLDSTETFQVNSSCESTLNMVHKSWFVLPPVEEYYYAAANTGYKRLPPFRADCLGGEVKKNMAFIYPKKGARIYVPRQLNSQTEEFIVEVAHPIPEKKIYWHLDHIYIGVTKQTHRLALSPEPGTHTLTLIDQDGDVIQNTFKILPPPLK